jgi:hypothetical protein
LVIVTISIAIGVVPLSRIIWECIARLVHVKLSTAEIEVVIVTVSIAIGVGPLQGVSRVKITLIGPSIAIAIRTSKSVLS